MSASPSAPAERPTIPTFTCAEIWGGNRDVDHRIELPGIRGRLISRPSDGGRGGDLHYVSICGSGLTSRLCLADVAGHGAAVSRVSNLIHELLHRFINALDQRRVLIALNQQLYREDLARMTTAAAVTYIYPFHELSLSYAGHPPAWFFRGDARQWERLALRSLGSRHARLIDIPLAIEEKTAFTRRKEHVNVGDRLVLVTDGVLEAPAPDGELFGDKRFEQLLAAHQDADADALADAILTELIAYTQDPELRHDDVSFMVLDFVRGPRARGIWTLLRNRLFGRRRTARRLVATPTDPT